MICDCICFKLVTQCASRRASNSIAYAPRRRDAARKLINRLRAASRRDAARQDVPNIGKGYEEEHPEREGNENKRQRQEAQKQEGRGQQHSSVHVLPAARHLATGYYVVRFDHKTGHCLFYKRDQNSKDLENQRENGTRAAKLECRMEIR